MNGIVLLPTLNRLELLNQFAESYTKTKATVPIWLLVDDKDFEQNSKAYFELTEKNPTFALVTTGDAVSMGDKVRYIWETLKAKNPKWVGLLNDDHYCITEEWDKKTDQLIDGTNMVSTNDGSWNFGFNVVGLTAWSMPLLEAVGFPIFPPGIEHWFIDNVWKSIGESSGCWLETMKINIEHRHVYIGKMKPDATFNKSNHRPQVEASQKAFERFMEHDFVETCKKILWLRSNKIVENKFV